MVMRSRATDGRSVSKCQRKWPDQPPTTVRAARGDGSCPNCASALQGARETANIQAGSGVSWRIPAKVLTIEAKDVALFAVRGQAMNSKKIWELVTRIYDNTLIALWAILLTFVFFLLTFDVPRLPEIWARIERIRAEEIAAEYAYYCERLGMQAGTQKHNQCLLDLGEFRLKVEKRLIDERDF
jgi:hypothetical protein